MAYNPLDFDGQSTLKGSTSGSLIQNAAAVTTSYSIFWPASQGSASTVLTNDGSGNLSWALTSATGVTSVSASVPSFLSVLVTNPTTTPNIAITLSGTALPIANGGTGATTASSAFNALNPMTTTGDMIYESGTNVASRLAIGTSGQVLAVVGGIPTWIAPPAAGVTSVDLAAPSIFIVSGNPVTTAGTLALALDLQSANTVFAGPSTGSAAEPTFRSLVAADIPSLSGSYLPLSGGALTGAVTSSSTITASNLSGTNTGDQTITLTGGVTGSGTSSFVATVITNANLTGVVTSVGNATSIANGAITNAMLALSYNVNLFTLSGTDITNKYVTLGTAPDIAGNTILTVIGGPMQSYGTDYTVSGANLSWSGLGLDGVLSSGDQLVVQYD